MRWCARLFASRRPTSEHRVETLRAEGRTIQLNELSPNDVVLRVFAFEREFWVAKPGYRLNLKEGRLEGGKLILDGDVRLKDARKLSFLKTPLEELVHSV